MKKPNTSAVTSKTSKTFTISLQHILDSLLEIIVVLDKDGRIVYANYTSCIILGYAPKELINTSFFDLIELGEKERAFYFLKQLQQGFPAIEFENQCKRKDRTWVFVSWTANWEEKDQLFYITLKTKDERNKAIELGIHSDAALKQRNQEMAKILDHMPDGFFTLDIEWRITYGNPKAEQIVGRKLEEVYLKTVWECFPSTRETVFETQYRKAMEEQTPVHFEAFYGKPLYKWLEVNVYPTANGLYVYFRDITERKETEEELRKLSVIAEETINAVVVSDPNRRIVWINRACEKLSGYNFNEAVGKLVSEIFDGPLTDGKKISYAESCFKSLQPFHIEVLNYKKNGETYWADVSSQPMFDEKGKLKYYFSISTDITSRKKLEEELQLQRKRTTAAVIAAQEKERALVGQELHDNVNQVLTTVKLYTELCRDGIGNSTEIMDKSIKLLQDSINEVRSLSKRLSAPSLGDIKLTESVRELVAAVKETNKLMVTLDVNGLEGVDVNQDVHLALYRILQEHLTNVLKHSEASRVDVNIEAKKGVLSLKVSDNGIGFDLQQKSSGIGISNMISRSENLKGTLVIKSAPGMGCELQVSFPLE